MHTILPFLLAMAAAVVLLEMLAAKMRIAYPILLVIAGLLLSFVPGLPVVKIDPDLIFFIFMKGSHSFRVSSLDFWFTIRRMNIARESFCFDRDATYMLCADAEVLLLRKGTTCGRKPALPN